MSQNNLPTNEDVLSDMLDQLLIDYLAEMPRQERGGPAYQRMMNFIRRVQARGADAITSSNPAQATAVAVAQNNNENNNAPVANNSEPNQPEGEINGENTVNNPQNMPKNKNTKGKNNDPKGGRRRRSLHLRCKPPPPLPTGSAAPMPGPSSRWCISWRCCPSPPSPGAAGIWSARRKPGRLMGRSCC